jgi:hypothetical protein
MSLSPYRPLLDQLNRPVKVQAIPRAGEKLAREFWTAAAKGSQALGGLLAPDSPAATLFRLYGANGPGTLLGMEAGPTQYTAAACPSHPGRPEAVSGRIQGGDHLYGYQITWRFDGLTALAEELLPTIAEAGRRMHPPWLIMKVISPGTRDLIAPWGLKRVERQIWKYSLPYCGLPPVLRMLTAWNRVPDHDALLQAHPPKAIAAAIDRIISHRAGDRGHYNESAGLYHIAEDAVRAANRPLARRLKLSATQLW